MLKRLICLFKGHAWSEWYPSCLAVMELRILMSDYNKAIGLPPSTDYVRWNIATDGNTYTDNLRRQLASMFGEDRHLQYLSWMRGRAEDEIANRRNGQVEGGADGIPKVSSM